MCTVLASQCIPRFSSLVMSSVSEDLVAKKKSFSCVWNYFGFKKNEDGSLIDETAPICRLCNSKISAKAGNTSNLFSHLKHKHSQQYAELKDVDKTQEKSLSRSGSSQPTVKQSFEASQPYARSSKRWEQLTDSIIYAVAKDSIPFLAVKKHGFKKNVSCL